MGNEDNLGAIPKGKTLEYTPQHVLRNGTSYNGVQITSNKRVNMVNSSLIDLELDDNAQNGNNRNLNDQIQLNGNSSNRNLVNNNNRESQDNLSSTSSRVTSPVQQNFITADDFTSFQQQVITMINSLQTNYKFFKN